MVPAGLCGSGHEGAGGVAGAGAGRLGASQGAAFGQAQGVCWRVGDPEGEEMAGQGVGGGGTGLIRGAETNDEADGVDVSFEQPAEAEIASSEKAERFHQRQGAGRFGAQAEAPQGGGEGRCEQAEVSQGGDVFGGEGRGGIQRGGAALEGWELRGEGGEHMLAALGGEGGGVRGFHADSERGGAVRRCLVDAGRSRRWAGWAFEGDGAWRTRPKFAWPVWMN